MTDHNDTQPVPQMASMVLYCLIRLDDESGVRYLVRETERGWAFPPTKFRPGEDLYSAMRRPMQGDLGLPPDSYFPESELQMIPNDKRGPDYSGLTTHWYLYPVDISLTEAGKQAIPSAGEDLRWMTAHELRQLVDEPNIIAILDYLDAHPLDKPAAQPTMKALACSWARDNDGGVRIARNSDIRRILSAGDRAFNLRVADPYLPYQRQGLGFTWSFFTPQDKQDVHVHSLPAIEVYGVFEGHLQVWHKPMNERGAHTWQKTDLGPGDWAEIEPLHCHFAFWTTPAGLGTVFKAAADGNLYEVGKIGVTGKTICNEQCPCLTQCHLHPEMLPFVEQYKMLFDERDYKLIAKLAGVDSEFRRTDK